jgi:NAD(P)H dehydrogenase (quinone)
MQILVLYFSRSGNTRKLAEAIASGVSQVPDAVPVVKSTEEVTQDDFTGAAGVIAGSPVYFGLMAAQLKEVFDKFVGIRKMMENKVGAAFATSGDISGGKETTMMSILQALLIYGMVVVGDPFSASGHYGVSCVGTPDEQTLENGRKLGERVARIARKLQT